MNDADYEKMSAFSCGVDELDKFFRCEVEECVKRHYSAAYCAVLGNDEIVAAFTLMNDALMISSIEEESVLISSNKHRTFGHIVKLSK